VQINCSYYSAVGDKDLWYLLARAIQFFTPGIPLVYYVGLLAGANDIELVENTKNGRDINRHSYGLEEAVAETDRPVVKAREALCLWLSTALPAMRVCWPLQLCAQKCCPADQALLCASGTRRLDKLADPQLSAAQARTLSYSQLKALSVQILFELARFRNAHPAFNGTFELLDTIQDIRDSILYVPDIAENALSSRDGGDGAGAFPGTYESHDRMFSEDGLGGSGFGAAMCAGVNADNLDENSNFLTDVVGASVDILASVDSMDAGDWCAPLSARSGALQQCKKQD
jgi:hypothetical protein